MLYLPAIAVILLVAASPAWAQSDNLRDVDATASNTNALAVSISTIVNDMARTLESILAEIYDHTSVLANLDGRTATMESRLGAIDSKMDALDSRIDALDRKVSLLLDGYGSDPRPDPYLPTDSINRTISSADFRAVSPVSVGPLAGDSYYKLDFGVKCDVPMRVIRAGATPGTDLYAPLSPSTWHGDYVGDWNGNYLYHSKYGPGDAVLNAPVEYVDEVVPADTRLDFIATIWYNNKVPKASLDRSDLPVDAFEVWMDVAASRTPKCTWSGLRPPVPDTVGLRDLLYSVTLTGAGPLRAFSDTIRCSGPTAISSIVTDTSDSMPYHEFTSLEVYADDNVNPGATYGFDEDGLLVPSMGSLPIYGTKFTISGDTTAQVVARVQYLGGSGVSCRVG